MANASTASMSHSSPTSSGPTALKQIRWASPQEIDSYFFSKKTETRSRSATITTIKNTTDDVAVATVEPSSSSSSSSSTSSSSLLLSPSVSSRTLSLASRASSGSGGNNTLSSAHQHPPSSTTTTTTTTTTTITLPNTIQGSPLDVRYAQYSYDNINFPDVIARMDYGANAFLEAVLDMVRSAATGEEMYAKSLADSATASYSARLRGTGQGIGVTIDGAVAVRKETSLLGTGLQAIGFGGLFGSSSSSSSGGGSSSSSSSSGAASNNTNSSNASSTPFSSTSSSSSSSSSTSGVVGNGSSSIGAALESFGRAQIKASHQRQMVAAHLRRLQAGIIAFKDGQTKQTSALLAKATEAVKQATLAARDLERVQQRVDRARQELANAEERFHSARAAGIVVSESELNKRHTAMNNATMELTNGENAVQSASELLVTVRRKRDEELKFIARQLQRIDEERLAYLSRTLHDVAVTAGGETAAASKLLAMSLAEAASSIVVDGDIRMFTYQRRIAHMLVEQTALQDARAGRAIMSPGSVVGHTAGSGGGGGSSSGSNNGSSSGSSSSMGLGRGEEEANVVPQPLPLAISQRHHRDFIQAEKQLSPIVTRWVHAVLAGKGFEALQGVCLPAVQEKVAVEEQDSETTTITTTNTTETTTTPPTTTMTTTEEETFDVEMLDHHAARIALLRTLNQQRSKKQDIGNSFYRLARVMWWLLDACEVHQDICCARMVMVMAETFFHRKAAATTSSSSPTAAAAAAATEAVTIRQEDDNNNDKPHPGTKEFLQVIVKRHPIWKCEAFWEEVFFQSLYDAVRASSNPYSNSSHNNTTLSSNNSGSSSDADASNDDAGDRTPSSPPPAPSSTSSSSSSSSSSFATVVRPGSSDWNYAYTQTVFSQLAAVAMNMITFGLSPDRVQRAVTRMARGNGLPPEMAHALHDTVKMYSNE